MSAEEKRPLPEGWSVARIPDLVASGGVFSDGDWVESKDQDPNGEIRLIQLADVGDGHYRDRSDRYLAHNKALELNCTFLEKGDVLIARMPDPLGRACIFPGDEKKSVTVVDVCIVRTLQGETNHKWIMYWVNSPEIRSEIEKYQSGTTRKRISRKNLAKIELPVPPIQEQEAIVAEIEKQFTRLDQAVASLKRALANLQRYKASVLKAACEGRLVPQDPNDEPAEILLQRIHTERRRQWEEGEWAKLVQKAQKKVAQSRRKAQRRPARLSDLDPQEWQDIHEDEYARYLPKNDKWKEKYKEPAVPETAELPDLPGGWGWATLEQLSGLITSGSRGWGKYYSDTGAIFIRAQDINTDSLKLESVAHVQLPETVEGTRARANQSDLLITITGANVTKTAQVTVELAEAYVSQHVGLAKLICKELAPFLYYWIISPPHGRRILENDAYGAGKPGLNLENLRELIIALPPLAEQNRIVAEVERRLSVVAANEKAIAADLARAERLRQSILQQAFSGQLLRTSGKTNYI